MRDESVAIAPEAPAPSRPARGSVLAALRLPARVTENLGLAAAAAVFALFLANYADLRLEGGDSPVQYAWVQHLYGDRVQPWGYFNTTKAFGYFFGMGLLEAPFYGLGKLFELAGLHSIAGYAIKPAMVSLGTGALLMGAAAALTARLVRALRLPAAGFSLLAAFFGSTLLYWVVFAPGKNHPADTALFTLVLFLTFAYFRTDEPARWLSWALGAALGFSITVRYSSGIEAVALIAVLACYRRFRHAAEIGVGTAAAFGLLYLFPLALGTPIFQSGPTKLATTTSQTGFYPLNPLRMLFTDYRGLFVWSPVAALATAGLVLLYRRRPARRRFLTAAYAMGGAIILSYALNPYWDGSFSFGQRYFAPLFPLVVLGLAALIEAARRAWRLAVVAATGAAALWSVFLCLNLFVLAPVNTRPWKVTVPIGATGTALLPESQHASAGSYLWALYYRSHVLKHLFPWPFSHR